MKNIEKKVLLVILFSFLFIITVSTFLRKDNTYFYGSDESYYDVTSKLIISNHWVLPATIPYINYDIGGLVLPKPPLGYYIHTFFYAIGLFKYFSLIFFLATIFVLWYFLRRYVKEETLFLAFIIMNLSYLVSSYAMAIYIETSLFFFLALTFIFIHKALVEKRRRDLVLAGIFFGLSVLVKEIGLFVVPTLFIYLLLLKLNKKYEKGMLKDIFLIILIGLMVASPYFIRNFVLWKNPVFPWLNSFLKSDLYDQTGLKMLLDRNIPSSLPQQLWREYGILLFLSIVSIGINSRSKNPLVLLTNSIVIWSFLTFILPASLIPYKSARILYYSLFWIGLNASFVLKDWSKRFNLKYSIIIPIIFISYLIFVSSYNIYYNSMRVVSMKPDADVINVTNWINANTPKDSNLYTFIMYDFYYYTGRNITFSTPLKGGMELYRFWDLNENEALRRLHVHKVNYIVIDEGFANLENFNNESTSWQPITEDFTTKIAQWTSFHLDYNASRFLVYSVG